MTTPANSLDVLVIGAGPTGMASAIEAKRAGFSVALVDKGCLVNSLFHYPANMVFFTTPELLEIGDIPFTSANQKPNRLEALEYYRNVAQHYQLDIHQYQRVIGVQAIQRGGCRVAIFVHAPYPETALRIGAAVVEATR